MTESVNSPTSAFEREMSAASFHAIANQRRSVYAYVDQPVARETVEAAISAAVLAPNHHRTSPWRFYVIPRESRDRLVAAYEAAARRVGRDVPRAAQRAKDAPVNVVIACVGSTGNPRVVLAEEEFAVAAAVQNFMLSLAAAGLGSLLTTGELAQSPEVAALVGLQEQPGTRLMGLINVGWRNIERPLAARNPSAMEAVTRWIRPSPN